MRLRRSVKPGPLPRMWSSTARASKSGWSRLIPRWPSTMWTCSPGCPTRRTRGRADRATRGRGDGLPPARLPGLELRPDQGVQGLRLEVAHGDQERVVGREVARVVGLDVVERQPGDLARRAARVAGVGVVAVDEPAEDQVGAEGRVVAVALQLGHDPTLGPGERLGGEGGPQRHVGQQLDGQGQVLGADAERDARRRRRRACRRRPRSPRPAPRPSAVCVPSSRSLPVR